jgi:hypothetical protein
MRALDSAYFLSLLLKTQTYNNALKAKRACRFQARLVSIRSGQRR